jgi:CubicO group peptidase (beta-lactamase class C family)
MEQRKLDPAAPIQRYVPGFPDKGAPITALQLAEHTSGIRHYAGDDEARSQRHCADVTAAMEIFADDPLVHAPGRRETYSSWGYVLLSAASLLRPLR